MDLRLPSDSVGVKNFENFERFKWDMLKLKGTDLFRLKNREFQICLSVSEKERKLVLEICQQSLERQLWSFIPTIS